MQNQLTVGTARRDITPEVGCHLFGYSPDIISTSVNDRLTATAVALCQNGTKVLLISATLGVFQTELSDSIRRQIAAETGAEHVILSATHTHSAPNTSGMAGWGGIDREYCDTILIPGILAAAKEAMSTVKPALMGVGTVLSNVGINRRQLGKDGEVILGQNPWGCYDPTMTVLRFVEPCGKAIVNIIHYGAHCTAAGANTEITRDWAGVMLDRLEAESGAPAAFINGAFGDVGPRLANGRTVGDISHAMDIGGTAALDAVCAWQNAKHVKPANLSAVTGELVLPVKPRPPHDTAQKLLNETDENAVNIAAQTRRYYIDVLDSYDKNMQEETHLTFQQTIVAVGGAAFVPFPFEVFSEITLRLREYSPFEHTLSMGCANGYEHYLPSRDQLCRGGYEVDMFRTSRIQPLADDADDNIIRGNLKLMEELKCTE